MQEFPAERFADMRGTLVYDKNGDKIGSVDDVFLDNDTARPEWLGVGGGLVSTPRAVVPVQGARVEAEAIQVAYAKEHVKGSPPVASDEITQETERELYAYYGLPYSEARSDSGLPQGPPGTATDVGDEASVTRSEEELRVGTRPVEAGRVRLRKWVETEPVTADVELERETARDERQPINQPVGDAELGDAEVEVPLRAEQPVVDKQTVAKDRVRIDKGVETRTETITEQVRKEQVDVEGDDVHRS